MKLLIIDSDPEAVELVEVTFGMTWPEATRLSASSGSYLSKLEQVVPKEWGRRVSYSKGWPKLDFEPWVRKGEIKWRHEWELEPGVMASFEHSRSLGWWREVRIARGTLEGYKEDGR